MYKMQNFTIASYTKLLQFFKEEYNFRLFNEYDQTDPSNTILLRHDIDYSLKYAHEIALLESNLGIKSTFFLLFSSPFYNILDGENIKLAKEIAKLGHEIGLHYDVNVILDGNKSDPQSLFNAEINLLSNLIDRPVRSIAMHNPSVSGEDIFRDAGYINAYDRKFVSDIAYFSDSGMAWRNNFINHLEQGSFPRKFQFLIHPILWSENEVNRYEKLDIFLETKVSEMEDMINVSREIWMNHFGVIEHDLRENNRKEGQK